MRGAVQLPRAFALELSIDGDVMPPRAADVRLSAMVGVGRRFDLTPDFALYPRLDLGVAYVPGSFEPVSLLYDAGAGALWRVWGPLVLRAEATMPGARVGAMVAW